DEGLLQAALERGAQLHQLLEGLVQRHPKKAKETRGMGLLRALQLAEGVDARATLTSLRDRGLLVTVAGGTALRFSPPLVITETQIEEAGQILDTVLGETE